MKSILALLDSINALASKIDAACEIIDYCEEADTAREIASVISRYANRIQMCTSGIAREIEQTQPTIINESEGHA